MMPQSERAPPGVQQNMQGSVEQAAGCTVRELVETTPELVTDSWCRQVAADLLHALEARQALDRPHSIIMPDTVIVHAGGAAELLASLDEDADFPAVFHPPIASDLKAIAALLHYAISGESPPGAALVPRGLPAFSDALLDTIDACLHGERSRRPQSIDAMRAGLGLAVAAPVAVEPVPTPAFTPAPAPATVSAAEELEAAIAGLAEAVGASQELEPEPAPAPALAPESMSPVALAKAAQPEIAHPAPTAPQSAPVPPPAATAPESHAAPPARLSRPLLACLAIGILGAAGFAIYEKGRQAGAEAVLAANAVAPAPVAVAPAVVPAPPPVPAPGGGRFPRGLPCSGRRRSLRRHSLWWRPLSGRGRRAA